MRPILTIVFFCFLNSGLRATTLVATDVPEMSREARAVALGRVVAVDSQWSADRRRIETVVTLAAEEYLKGGLGSSVQFAIPGGELGRYRQIVVGAPRVQVGERIVVFLGARAPGIAFILGFNQGLFRVTLRDGAWLVAPAAPIGPVAANRGVAPRRVPLTDFAREVRTLATRPDPTRERR